MISFTELCEQLGVSKPALSKLIKDGLPFEVDGRRKVFDDEAVAQWLIDNNLATVGDDDGTEEHVARTRKECAEYFAVHLRTVADWLEDSSFPGRSGTRGRRDGYFPLEEIKEWLARRDALRNGGPQVGRDVKDELYALKLERARYEFEQYKGNLVTIEAVRSEQAKQINIAKKILEAMPDKAAKALPAKTPADVRAKIIKRWRDCVYEVERTIAEAITVDSGEQND